MALGGRWRFMPDLRDLGIAAGWHRPRTADGDWLAVPVGRPWDTYGEAFRGYEDVAWFRRAFAWNRARPAIARLEFAGAGHHADVWLNGRRIGSHDGGYVPFALDVAPALRRGRNVLAIRIRHVFGGETTPIRNTDWWKYGGITRPVTLVANDGPLIARSTVTTQGVASTPLIVARGRIASPAPGLTMVATVRAANGRTVESAPEPVDPSGAFRIALPGRGFPLWSPESPRLVHMTLTLRDRRGRVVDRVGRRFGIRVLSWAGGVLRLNGRRLVLRGVNQVEEYPAWTCSPGRSAMRARIRDLTRNLHANFFRTAHYPHQPDFLDLCDEEGLLTCGEIPFCYQPEAPGTTAAGRVALDELVWRDAHHPSVIWWSTGNERPVEDPKVAAGVVALIRHAKTLDDSRPVTCVSNRGLGDRSLPAHDLLALNMYVGVWGGTTPLAAQGLRRHAAHELAAALVAVRRRFPDKPLVISEFGAPAFPLPGGVFGGLRWQAEYLRIHLEVFARTRWLSGCVAWCYADQRVGSYGRYPVGYLGTPQLEVFGLKTIHGAPKPAWRVVARAYRRLARRRA
ncbi:MAG: glycoside hydrolase family 2 TIM barrel-domain containing protein [Candidatus Coatesbacteria bacterium]